MMGFNNDCSRGVTRRSYLQTAAAGAATALAGAFPSSERLWAEDSLGAGSAPSAGIGPGTMGIRVPTLDLFFSDDLGMAHWWLPEVVLPGKTDGGPKVPNVVRWEPTSDGATMGYSALSPDGKVHSAVAVTQVALGWHASMTITNRTDEKWPDVVCAVCLLLQSSHFFVDPDWQRTYYRTNQTYKTYFGRERESGQPVFQMSLVQGRRQIVRSERHINKWGYTLEPSDDGIIAVVNAERKMTLVTTWEPTHHLQANRKPTYHCIHANPYLGTLEPGASSTVRGCVLLVPGDLDAAWKEAHAAVGRA